MFDAALSDGLAAFNRLSADRARAELLSCCASPAWAEQMLAARPYHSVEEVMALNDRAVAGLSEAELDVALAGHPRIGEGETAAASGGRDWSSQEQAGVDRAADGVRRALADGNRAYERRFGHVYLVCATGRTADEMLALLHRRLGNDPASERAVVRDELAKINRIRLTKLLEGV
jgi:2-oxo-4-hydroxy-4-carboxy-5-ureidoimidazoline decarboxylase